MHNIIFRQLQKFASYRLAQRHTSPVLFVADEYVAMAAEQHLDAFQEMRESNVVSIIGTQGRSNLAAKIGDKAAEGICGCFATQIAFRCNDATSRRHYNDHCAQTEVPMISTAQNKLFSGGIHPHAIASQAITAMLGGNKSYSTWNRRSTAFGIWSAYIREAQTERKKRTTTTTRSVAAASKRRRSSSRPSTGLERRGVSTFPVTTADVIGA